MLKYNVYNLIAQLGNLLVLIGDVVIMIFIFVVRIWKIHSILLYLFFVYLVKPSVH
jgi:hypothetical protein